MSRPAGKSDPNPMKFFEGAQQNYPTPKTREEAGQLAVDARHDALDKIADPKQRVKAENALRSLAEKSFGTTDKYVEKVKASQARWEQKLNSLSEKNPVRQAAAPVVRAVQRRQRQDIGAMVLKSAHKSADIMTRAQKASASFRERAQSQPAKDNERER